ALSERFTTLAESLAGVGYETWAFSANPHIAPEFGFAQGFSRWWETRSREGEDLLEKLLPEWESRERGSVPRDGRESPPSQASAARAREGPPDSGALSAAGAPPLFLYLHFMDVHNPYDPPSPWNRAFPAPRQGRVVYQNGPVTLSPDDLA